MLLLRKEVLLLLVSLIVIPSKVSFAEDAIQRDLLDAVRLGITARQAQLANSQFTVKRVFGPEQGALDVAKAQMVFLKAWAKAGKFTLPSRPASITDEDKNPPILTKTEEYWTCLSSDDRLALYYSLSSAPAPSSGWTFRSFFNGDHWEQYLTTTSLGPLVRIMPKTDAPPIRVFVGLDQPALLNPDWASFMSLFTPNGSGWVLDSCQLLADSKEMARVVVAHHHVPVSAAVPVPMLMTSRWNLDKDGAPLDLEVKFGVTEAGRVVPIKISQGFRVVWRDYRLIDELAWVPSAMEIEKFNGSYVASTEGKVAFLEKDGVLVKDRDGFPGVDDSHSDTREFIVEREIWELVEAKAKSESDAIRSAESYTPGTIVQNELGSKIEVYQLLEVSPAVTTTMRKMLEGGLALAVPSRKNTLYDFIVVNLVIFAVIALIFAARKLVRSRRG